MKLLAIETSTNKAQVALTVEGKFAERCQKGVREHASCILPMVDEILQDAGLSIADLDGLVFGRGPGSFTGLRVAASVVQGLGLAQNLLIYPVSGLAAIAYEASMQQKGDLPILAVIDARMQEVYWSYYATMESEVSENLSAVSAITIPKDRPFLLAGVGFETYLSDLPSSLLADKIEVYPEAVAMLKLVLARKVKPVAASKALPVYIRNQVIQGPSRG